MAIKNSKIKNFQSFFNFVAALAIFFRGGGTIQKVGAQITLKLKKAGAQTFHFHYLRHKKWVRSCALCALGSAAPDMYWI